MIDSAKFRTPRGARELSWREARKKITIPTSAAMTAISAILLNDGKMSCQRRTALIGGNSSPSTWLSVPGFVSGE